MSETQTVTAVREDALLIPLPPVPESFTKQLSQIATRNGVPMFRLADGLREKKWRNGKWDVKHLLQSNGIPCYIPVVKVRYRRRNVKTGDYKIYRTHEQARSDKTKHLSFEIDYTRHRSVVAIGRPCWVVEVYIAPEEIDYDSWQACRYQVLEKNRVSQKIDQLGEYPRDGMYIACFDVIGSDGNAVSPSERTLDECRRRWKAATSETQTVEDAIQCSNDDLQKFEEKQLARMNDNFVQWAGITNTRGKAGVIGKPIAAH